MKGEMEYYWVIHDVLAGHDMYWTLDKYYTILFTPHDIEESDLLIKIIKIVMPKNLEYVSHTISIFDPQNGHLPDVPKKLISFTVRNGLTQVGPVWAPASSPGEFLKNKIPTGYYSISTEEETNFF